MATLCKAVSRGDNVYDYNFGYSLKLILMQTLLVT